MSQSFTRISELTCQKSRWMTIIPSERGHAFTQVTLFERPRNNKFPSVREEQIPSCLTTSYHTIHACPMTIHSPLSQLTRNSIKAHTSHVQNSQRLRSKDHADQWLALILQRTLLTLSEILVKPFSAGQSSICFRTYTRVPGIVSNTYGSRNLAIPTSSHTSHLRCSSVPINTLTRDK
jgi:hypothetical protein